MVSSRSSAAPASKGLREALRERSSGNPNSKKHSNTETPLETFCVRSKGLSRENARGGCVQPLLVRKGQRFQPGIGILPGESLQSWTWVPTSGRASSSGLNSRNQASIALENSPCSKARQVPSPQSQVLHPTNTTLGLTDAGQVLTGADASFCCPAVPPCAESLREELPPGQRCTLSLVSPVTSAL